MKKIKKPIIITLLALVSLLLFAAYFFTNIYSTHGNPIRSIEVGGYEVRAEVVQSPEKRELGLGSRKGLCASCGMLFVFDKKGDYAFWMKDMEFPIDILWLDDGKVVHIEENVSHIDQQKTYTSPQSASMVLELPAGTCEREDIKKDLTITSE